MTDRIHSFTVVLTDDTRDDDAQPLIDAIKMLRGVLDVRPHVATVESHMAEVRAKHAIRRRIWDALEEPPDGK